METQLVRQVHDRRDVEINRKQRWTERSVGHRRRRSSDGSNLDMRHPARHDRFDRNRRSESGRLRGCAARTRRRTDERRTDDSEPREDSARRVNYQGARAGRAHDARQRIK
jgi:hypothetical protein